MKYGSLVGAGIEGYIKTRQEIGAARFIETEYQKQVAEFGTSDEISWWTQLAQAQVQIWIKHYAADLDRLQIKEAETYHELEIKLPSGRTLKLHGYTDGEGPISFMEGKVRSEWDTESVASEIQLNLQLNVYTLMFQIKHGRLPSNIWYQHTRRPCGWNYGSGAGSSGPRRKKNESDEVFKKRIITFMNDEPDYHFFRYFVRPNQDTVSRFQHLILFPMLEAFLDWYEWYIHPDRANQVNRFHWTTPYGLYNPFLEGTAERFRSFRLTGSTLGLRPRMKRPNPSDPPSAT
jgi:hypothetical protein